MPFRYGGYTKPMGKHTAHGRRLLLKQDGGTRRRTVGVKTNYYQTVDAMQSAPWSSHNTTLSVSEIAHRGGKSFSIDETLINYAIPNGCPSCSILVAMRLLLLVMLACCGNSRVNVCLHLGRDRHLLNSVLNIV